MKVVSNVRNIYRSVLAPITWTPASNPIPIIVDTPPPPAGQQAAQPDSVAQTWRSLPSVGTWRPLGEITESKWTATPILWSSNRIQQGGVGISATVELPEILSMVGCPTALFFSIGIALGSESTEKHSDWNCFVNVGNLFARAQITNPGFLIRDTFAEFTGCIYGNLRKTLKDTSISVTMNGFYGASIFDKPQDFVHFNVSGSALTLN
jgi:hypothetical protein